MIFRKTGLYVNLYITFFVNKKLTIDIDMYNNYDLNININ